MNPFCLQTTLFTCCRVACYVTLAYLSGLSFPRDATNTAGLPMNAAFEKVLVGAGTAIMLGAVAIGWNWLTQGGLIRAMGGLTQIDIVDMSLLPKGAVVAR